MRNYFLLIFFMNIYGYGSSFKVTCSTPYENKVSNIVCQDSKLYKNNKSLEQFIELYKKTLNKKATKKFTKNIVSWKIEEKKCLNKAKNKLCLKKLYVEIRDELKKTYIREHEIISINYFYAQFYQMYQKKISNKITTVTFMNDSGDEKKCTNSQEEEIIAGYALLVQGYFTLETFFKKNIFSESIDVSVLSNYSYTRESLIEYTLNRVSMKKIKSTAVKFLSLLNKKEIEGVYSYLKALEDTYVNSYGYKDEVCNLHFVVNISSDNYPLSISNEPIYQQMNKFWNRRIKDNTEKRVYEILQFFLDKIEEKLLIGKRHFKDYIVDTIYIKPNQSLVEKDFGKRYRTRLTQALKEKKTEFSGKYIIAQWGCDEGENGCTTGGIIDASTGEAVAFPFKYYESNGIQKILYRRNSSLIIFAGDFKFENNRVEKRKVLFYEFKNGKFLFLDKEDFLIVLSDIEFINFDTSRKEYLFVGSDTYVRYS